MTVLKYENVHDVPDTIWEYLAKIEYTLRRILAEANIDLEKVRNLAGESRPDNNMVSVDASEIAQQCEIHHECCWLRSMPVSRIVGFA